jgi:hypothetical protein
MPVQPRFPRGIRDIVKCSAGFDTSVDILLKCRQCIERITRDLRGVRLYISRGFLPVYFNW